jgi:rubrerythrin
MDVEGYKKIIGLAIAREVESYSFYRGAADKVKDLALKRMFTELAGEETKHREFLQGLLAKPVKDLRFDTHRDYRVVDEKEIPALSTDMKPLDGLVLAIKKELGAMQMYTQLASLSTDAQQKKLFTELATMERGHKARLEDIYTNMAFPESW